VTVLTTLRASTFRAVAGGAMALLGAGIFIFALPERRQAPRKQREGREGGLRGPEAPGG